MLKLKEIRKQKGLTQLDIARILNVKQQTASRLENGINKLNEEQIMQLCLALDVTPNELLGFEEAYKKYTAYLESLKEEEQEN